MIMILVLQKDVKKAVAQIKGLLLRRFCVGFYVRKCPKKVLKIAKNGLNTVFLRTNPTF